MPVLEEGKLPTLRFNELENGDFEVIAYKRKREPGTWRMYEVGSIPVGSTKFYSYGDIHFNAAFIAANPWIRKFSACRSGGTSAIHKKSEAKLEAEEKLHSLLRAELEQDGLNFDRLTDQELVQLLRRKPGRELHAGAAWLLAKKAYDLVIPSRLSGQFDDDESPQAAVLLFSAALFLAVTGDKDLSNFQAFAQGALLPEELESFDVTALLRQHDCAERFVFFFGDIYDLWQDRHWQDVRAEPPRQVLLAVDSTIGTASGNTPYSALQLYDLDFGFPLGCSLCEGARPSYRQIARELRRLVYFHLDGQMCLVTALCHRDGSQVNASQDISVRAEVQAAYQAGLSVIFKYEPDGKCTDPWLDAQIEKYLPELLSDTSFNEELGLQALTVTLPGVEPESRMYLHLYLKPQDSEPAELQTYPFKGLGVLVSDCIGDSLAAYRFLQGREMLCAEFARPEGWLELNVRPSEDEEEYLEYLQCRVYLQYLAASLLLSLQMFMGEHSLTVRQALHKLHNLMAHEYQGIGFVLDEPDAGQKQLMQEQKVVPPDSAAVQQREDLRLFLT